MFYVEADRPEVHGQHMPSDFVSIDRDYLKRQINEIKIRGVSCKIVTELYRDTRKSCERPFGMGYWIFQRIYLGSKRKHAGIFFDDHCSWDNIKGSNSDKKHCMDKFLKPYRDEIKKKLEEELEEEYRKRSYNWEKSLKPGRN